MNDDRRNNQGQDTYDMLHQSFSMKDGASADYAGTPGTGDNGEIYFSSRSDRSRQSRYDTKLYDDGAFGRAAASSGQRSTSVSRGGSQQRTSSRSSQADSYASRGNASSRSSTRSASSSRAGGAASGASSSSSRSSSASSGKKTASYTSSGAGATRSRGSASASSSGTRASERSGSRSSSSRDYDRQAGSRSSRSAASAARSAAGKKSTGAASSRSARAKEAEAYKEPAKQKNKKKQSDGRKRGSGFALAAIVIIFVVVVSFLLRIPIMGCINDILAINRDATEIRVTVGENMNTNDVIDLLKENDLIFSAEFCKFIYSLMGHDETEIYPAGTYEVSADMGLEGMMREIITAGATDSTVSITFPEGFTLDQIIEKLASNGVASSSALYAVVDDPAFMQEYDFLAGIEDREQRYHYLEGYMYPDTYDFYIGENPQSVIGRFLKNFQQKWNEEFADRLERSGHTMDEILTVASILEKEAKDADQMPLVASIIFNRLDSSSFPNLQCDSTAKYVENNKSKLVQAGRYASLLKVYDTYQVTGLPVGPICNPGYNAISAALSPEVTDYYYFIHDATGQIYLARNQQEHEENRELAGIS